MTWEFVRTWNDIAKANDAMRMFDPNTEPKRFVASKTLFREPKWKREAYFNLQRR
jgi:hypothetical protein